MIHAGRSFEGVPLGDQGGFGRSFGTGVRVSAVVIAHGLDVAAAAHAATRDLPTAVDGIAATIPTSPVFRGDLGHSHMHSGD